jgi:hypothetical protein
VATERRARPTDPNSRFERLSSPALPGITYRTDVARSGFDFDNMSAAAVLSHDGHLHIASQPDNPLDEVAAEYSRHALLAGP